MKIIQYLFPARKRTNKISIITKIKSLLLNLDLNINNKTNEVTSKNELQHKWNRATLHEMKWNELKSGRNINNDLVLAGGFYFFHLLIQDRVGANIKNL